MPIAFMSVTCTIPERAAVKRRVEVEEMTAGERLICAFATFTMEIASVASELEDSAISSLLEERTVSSEPEDSITSLLDESTVSLLEESFVSLLDESTTSLLEEAAAELEETAELEEAVELAAVTVIVPDFEAFDVAPVVVTVNL